MATHDIQTILNKNLTDSEHKTSCNNIPIGISSIDNTYYTIDVDTDGIQSTKNYIWDTNLLDWIPMQQPILNAGSVVVSGNVTANAGTNLNTSALALESGGNLANIYTRQGNGAQKTQIVDGSGNVISSASNYLNTNIKVVNTAGSPQGVLMESGTITTRTYQEAIAHGDLVDHTPWVMNGYNGALSNVSEDVWAVGGVYVFPTVQQQMEVISSSVDDTAAGTGVQSVNINYLDNTFAEHTITLTMNGTTPVPTGVTNIYRVNYIASATVGTNGFAVGNIDIRTLTTGTYIYGRIPAGTNVERDFIYTVPYGKVLYVTNVLFSCAGNVANRPVTFTTRTTWDRQFNAARNFFIGYTEVTLIDNVLDMLIEFPTRLPAGTDFKISAISPDGATYASVVGRGWLETA